MQHPTVSLLETFRAGVGQVAGVGLGLTQTATATITQPVDLDRAIRVLELKIGGQWTEPGGAMRWTPVQWSRLTALPYILSQRVPQSRWVARQMIAGWVAEIQGHGVAVTPEILFYAFERGTSAAMRHAKDSSWDRFTRDCAVTYGNLGH